MSRNRKYLLTYGAAFFFIYSAVAALFPFFPLILQHKGFTPSEIGFIMGGYDLVSIGGLLILGLLYDRIASPRLSIASIIIICAGLLLTLVFSDAPVLIIAVTLLIGIFVKSPMSLLDAHFGQALPGLAENYGRTRLGGSLGFMLMALLIQISGAVKGSRPVTVFMAYGLSMICTITVIALLPPVANKDDWDSGEHVRGDLISTVRSFPGIYWIGLLIAFLNAMALSGHYTFFSLLLKNKFGLENVSGFWAIGPLFEIPLFFFSSYLLRKIKLRTLWSFSMIAGFARMQTYSLAESLLPLYLIQVTHSFSFGINHLCMVNLINRKTPPSGRGLAMSIYTAIGMGLSLFTGGILGGLILRNGDFPLLFQVFSYFPLAAIAIAVLFLSASDNRSFRNQGD